jgi:hypothetical protein
MKVRSAGENLYYSVGNFSQRADLVQAALRGTLHNSRDVKIANALFEKIRRLWKARNNLVHSHYVYEGVTKTFTARLTGLTQALGKHPKDKFRDDWGDHMTTGRFVYEARGVGGDIRYVPVNKGTFENHAAQLSKRTRQIMRLEKAIELEVAPLKSGIVVLPDISRRRSALAQALAPKPPAAKSRRPRPPRPPRK